MNTYPGLILALSLSLCAAQSAQAKDLETTPVTFTSTCKAGDTPLSRYFAPRPYGSANVTLDFGLWDKTLYGIVVHTGASVRQQARRPLPSVGSRVHYGHKSPYRFEGNKVKFEKFSPDLKANLDLLVGEMVSVGHEVDIPSLPRSAQLAYWFNLHNAVMVNALSKGYPVKTPSTFIPQRQSAVLDEAKLINICGRDLSLRDIRENIIYPNWADDPTVIYGFWRGDIGSPNLNYKAFSPYNVRQVLAANANEFTNSFRGYRLFKGERVVSPLYRDDGKIFFESPAALEAHIAYFLRPDLKAEFMRRAPLTYGKTHPTIADLSGGEIPRYKSVKNSYDNTYMGSSAGQRMLIGLEKKQEEQIRQGIAPGRNIGKVTIEDIPTVEFKVNWTIPTVREVTDDNSEN